MRLGLAAIHLFAWVFVFQYFYSRTPDIRHALIYTALFYAISQGVALLLTPYSAKRLSRGVKWPMVQGIVLVALAYTVLAFGFSGALGPFIFGSVLVFAILRGLYRASYWVPYQVESSGAQTRSSRSRAIQESAIALAPAISGIILAAGFPGYFFVSSVAVVLLCFALIVLARVPDRTEVYEWNYIETFKKFFEPRFTTLVLIAFLEGLSGAGLLLFWPIAIFLLVGWSYPTLGIVMSLTYLMVYFGRSYAHALLRSARLEQSALVHAGLAASGWLFRLLVSSPLSIVLVDTYYFAGAQPRGTGLDTLTFEQAADGGSYIDELTALKEMALAAGKILMCAFGISLLLITTLPKAFIAIFLVAAMVSGISVYLAYRKQTS